MRNPKSNGQRLKKLISSSDNLNSCAGGCAGGCAEIVDGSTGRWSNEAPSAADCATGHVF